jgi:hypothetical protein
MGEKHVRDVVSKWNATNEEIAAHLRDVGKTMQHCCQWMTKNLTRDERNVALFNLLSAHIPYLEVVRSELAGAGRRSRTMHPKRIRVEHPGSTRSPVRAKSACVDSRSC